MYDTQQLTDISIGGRSQGDPALRGMLDESEKEAREEHDKAALRRSSSTMLRRQQTATQERLFSLD